MDRTYQINNSVITVKYGSIIDSKADVIVSSDDYMLSMGGGVSATIRMAGGNEICNDARKKIPAPLGDVVVTTAGNLSQKFIFHAVTIDGESINKYNGNAIQKANLQKSIIHYSMKKIFRLMANLDMHTIAFPTIGAGVAGIPYDQVAKNMGEAFAEILSTTNKAYQIELYLYDRFKHMNEWDFLPVFEALAEARMYSQLRHSSFEETEKIDYSSVNILDTNDGADIFISYSRRDLEEVKGLCELLNSMGVSYWIDVNGTYSGENYKEVIVKAIERAKIVLFISSANSNASSNVAKEIDIADKMKKRILPIRLDDAPYARQIAYDMNSVDYIDYDVRNITAKEKIKDAINASLFILNNAKR